MPRPQVVSVVNHLVTVVVRCFVFVYCHAHPWYRPPFMLIICSYPCYRPSFTLMVCSCPASSLRDFGGITRCFIAVYIFHYICPPSSSPSSVVFFLSTVQYYLVSSTVFFIHALCRQFVSSANYLSLYCCLNCCLLQLSTPPSY